MPCKHLVIINVIIVVIIIVITIVTIIHSRKKSGSWIPVLFRPKLGNLRQDRESWRRLGKFIQKIRKVKSET